MSANRVRAPTNCRYTGTRRSQQEPSRASKVLAERNQAVVAVGAWVEGGQDFLEHPAALALLTEELQAQKRRENEDKLRRFQAEVRQRVAHICDRRHQPLTHPSVKYLYLVVKSWEEKKQTKKQADKGEWLICSKC